MGEEDKMKLCSGKALPMVMETFGRLGPESEKVLNLLAMAAGQAARSRPVLHVWRDMLRRELWFAVPAREHRGSRAVVRRAVIVM